MSDILSKLQVVNPPGSLQYRLGDAVVWGKPGACRSMMNPKFAGTIGQKYLSKTKRNSNNGGVDCKLMRSLVEEHLVDNRLRLPGRDEIVLHYRAGDAKLSAGGEVISAVHEAFKDTGYSKLVIVTALHNVNGKGVKYIGELESVVHWAEESGLDVSFLSTKSPDDDFAFLVSASCLVTTRGNFSDLAFQVSSARKYSVKKS